MPKFTTIDEYLETLSTAARASFTQISLLIHQLVPHVQVAFSYGVPAFKVANQTICLVAGFKRHIGIYPGPEVIATMAKQLAQYDTAKGTIRFALDQPLPVALISEIIRHKLSRLQVES